MAEKKYKDIGGWLYLLGIGLSLSVFRLFFESAKVVKFLGFGPWSIATLDLISPSPFWIYVILLKFATNAILLLWLLYLIILYSKRDFRFPRFFISTLLIVLIIGPLNSLIQYFVIPSKPVIDSETFSRFFYNLIIAVIWIPYMLKSKRVKLTFVEHRPVEKV